MREPPRYGGSCTQFHRIDGRERRRRRGRELLVALLEQRLQLLVGAEAEGGGASRASIDPTLERGQRERLSIVRLCVRWDEREGGVGRGKRVLMPAGRALRGREVGME